ncbi:hypothetical protein quinque_012140 [Culex quinquefasciatus]
MKASLLGLLTLCGLISSIVAQDAACTTPDRKPGLCVEISRCQNIYSIVSSPNPNPVYDKYIRAIACTVPGAARSVCCRPSEVVAKPTTTTTTTTPVVPVIRVDQEDKLALLPEDCGKTTADRISRGNVTKVFDHPWMVLLQYRHKGAVIGGCGGSLINERYVLTAAHCIRTRSSLQLINARLGEHTRNSAIDCNVYLDPEGNEIERDCADPAEDYAVESFVVHPDFNRPRRFSNDIGLIRLDRTVVMKHHIQPLCLPVTEDLRTKQFKKYLVTGWGATENQTGSDVLLKAVVPRVSNEVCQQRMVENRLNIQLTELQMCAGGQDLVDTCSGDSGGPLGMSSNFKGVDRFVQYGVVSAGVNSCGQKSVPGIYARVVNYMDWILDTIQP